MKIIIETNCEECLANISQFLIERGRFNDHVKYEIIPSTIEKEDTIIHIPKLKAKPLDEIWSEKKK